MHIQSNGMGQQSAALYLMSQLGIFPKLDFSIFADPGREKTDTYKYVKWLIEKQKENKWTPIIWDKSKNLYKDLLKASNSTGNRFASLPAYTENGGMIRRQCTNEYKIDVVNNAIRKAQNKKKGQSFLPNTNLWFGISLDEISRMNAPHRKNVTNIYPFCGYYNSGDGFKTLDWSKQMSRSQINKWMIDHGYPIPPKSACVFCPFTKNPGWRTLKKNPSDFKAAVLIDKRIRNNAKMKEQIFIHNSLKPLDQADLNEEQTEINFDCYGYCGT